MARYEDLPLKVDPEVVEQTAAMLRCLGHPVRLAILDVLERGGEQTVTEIYETLGVAQAVCSQHLTLLRDKGVLGHRREGVNAYYSIGDPRALKVLACLRSQEPGSETGAKGSGSKRRGRGDG